MTVDIMEEEGGGEGESSSKVKRVGLSAELKLPTLGLCLACSLDVRVDVLHPGIRPIVAATRFEYPRCE